MPPEFQSAENKLLISEELVRLATEAAGLGVWVWNPQSDHVSWENSRPWELFGLPDSAAPVNSASFLADFVHPDDADQFRQAAVRTIEHGERFFFQGRVSRADGQQRWLELTGRRLPGKDGRPELVLGTAADITERRLSEHSVREHEARYHALFNSIDEGFCIIEMLYDEDWHPVDYRFLEANPAFMRQTGFTAEAIGMTIKELAPLHESHWFEIYDKVAVTRQPLRFQNEAAALNRWYDVYAMPHGEPESHRVAILFSDITERKRSELRLQQLASDLAESDRRKSEFLATLAHELRNPLAPVCNGIQVMRLAADNPETVARVRDMMERQLNQLVHLVNDLLDLSRITNDKLELRREQVDLKSIVASAIETSLLLIDSKRHALTVHTPSEALMVDADPTRIAQVLSNLLNNAAKYTPPEGRINLSVARQDDKVTVTVTDTGVGIPKESLGKVFDMFAQVGPSMDRGGGLGVGLSLVRRLVELHGGSVHAESNGPGHGSSFVLALPLRAATPATSGAAQAAAGALSPAAHATFRILVADDNVDAASTLCAILDIAGHSSRAAHDGKSALALAQEFLPEVIFLDIGMPGMDGYQVARELRKLPAMQSVVLVALTGWGAETDRARTRAAGFDHHMTKPASIGEVYALLAGLALGANPNSLPE